MINSIRLMGVYAHQRLVRQITTVFQKDIIDEPRFEKAFSGEMCGAATVILYLCLAKRGWADGWKFRHQMPDNGLNWHQNVRLNTYHTTLIHPKSDIMVDASDNMEMGQVLLGTSHNITKVVSSLYPDWTKVEILEPEIALMSDDQLLEEVAQ